MNLNALVEVCHEYAALGWAIHEQLDSLVQESADPDDYNMTALEYIRDWLDFVEDRQGEDDEPSIARQRLNEMLGDDIT